MYLDKLLVCLHSLFVLVSDNEDCTGVAMTSSRPSVFVCRARLVPSLESVTVLNTLQLTATWLLFLYPSAARYD